jgi:hypothetical protein
MQGIISSSCGSSHNSTDLFIIYFSMALPAYSEPMPAIQFRNNIFTDFLDE